MYQKICIPKLKTDKKNYLYTSTKCVVDVVMYNLVAAIVQV